MAEPAMKYEAYDPYEEAEDYGPLGGDDPEFYSPEGLDVEYIARMLQESEEDTGPGITLDELKKKHREKFGYGI